MRTLMSWHRLRLHFAGAADALSTGLPGHAAAAAAVPRRRVSTVSSARDVLDHRHGVADASIEGGSDWSDFSSEGSAEESQERDEEVRGHGMYSRRQAHSLPNIAMTSGA